MPRNQVPKPRWSPVKAAVSRLDEVALLELIRDLYGLSASNQQFVEVRLGLQRDPLGPYKAIITECMYPDVFEKQTIQISKAKKAIGEYRKAVRDVPGEIELMVHFVESGNRFTLEYGDLDEGFYDALLLMYDRAIKGIKDLPDPQRTAFRDRLEEIARSAKGIGWGYGDGLLDAFYLAFAKSGI